MSITQLPVKEILLTLIGFVLGIVSTLISQLIARRFKFTDARLKLRYENLKKFRGWMEAYRDILKCKYPNIMELWLSPAIAPRLGYKIEEFYFDPNQAVDILRLLKEFRDAKRVTDKVREMGEEAFYSLIEPLPLWHIRNWLPWLYSRDARTFGLGITLEVIGHLRKFHTHYDFLYSSIEKRYAETQIDWEKLDTIEPKDLHTIIVHPQLRYFQPHVHDMSSDLADEYREKYDKLTGAIDNIDFIKREANQELESIFEVIRKYENLWIPPG